jgi:heat shock protein HslJ
MIRRHRRLLVALAMTALLVVACGDDDTVGSTSEVPATPSSEVAATSSPTTEMPSTTEMSSTTAPEGTAATIPPPLDLAGTSWVPTEYTQSDGSITNILGEDVVLVFGADGSLSGFNGCNEFEGTWATTGPYYDYDEGQEAFEDKHDGQPIAITAETTTSVECDGFLGDQDTDLLASLTGTEFWYIGNIFGDQEAGITLNGEGAGVFADPA